MRWIDKFPLLQFPEPQQALHQLRADTKPVQIHLPIRTARMGLLMIEGQPDLLAAQDLQTYSTPCGLIKNTYGEQAGRISLPSSGRWLVSGPWQVYALYFLEQNNTIDPTCDAWFILNYNPGKALHQIAQATVDVGAKQGAKKIYKPARKCDLFPLRQEFVKYHGSPTRSKRLPCRT